MADEIPDSVRFLEYEKEGVIHRVPITPEEARDFIDRKTALGHMDGEPFVDENDRLVEHHGDAPNLVEPDDEEDPDDQEP